RVQQAVDVYFPAPAERLGGEQARIVRTPHADLHALRGRGPPVVVHACECALWSRDVGSVLFGHCVFPSAAVTFHIHDSTNIHNSDNDCRIDAVDSVELLLHPVRMRIVQAFLGDRALTTAALGEELGDVPPGSLYRHIARLVDGGVLTVADERRVRGTVERTYRLELAAAGVDPGDLAAMTAEDHRRAFLA